MSSNQCDRIEGLTSSKFTLELLNIQINPTLSFTAAAFDCAFPLFRHIKLKNIESAVMKQEKRLQQPQEHNKQAASDQPTHIFGQLEARVRQQVEKVKQAVREEQLTKKHLLKNTQQSEQSKIGWLMQRGENYDQVANILGYLEEACQTEARELAGQMEMWGQSRESLPQLIHCFKHMFHADQPLQLVSAGRHHHKPAFRLSLSQYKHLFKRILAQRHQSSHQSSHQHQHHPIKLLVRILDSGAQFPAPLNRNSFLQGLFLQLRWLAKRHTKDAPKRIICDQQNLLQFLQLEEDPHPNQNLSKAGLWQRVGSLIRKGPKYHSFVGIHLLQLKQTALYQYFNSILQAKPQSYQQDALLYNSNQHYRDFLNIIQRKYSKQIIEQKSRIGKLEAAAAAKEILLSLPLRQAPQSQLEVIRKYALELAKTANSKAKASHKYLEVQPEIRQLMLLGQLSSATRILVDCNKVNAVEALLVLSALSSVDLSSSDLLLFRSQPLSSLYFQLLMRTVKEGERGSCWELCLLLKVFVASVPFKKQATPQLVLDLLSLNKYLFKHVVEEEGLWAQLRHYGLKFEQTSALLSKIMSQHSIYAYCCQLALQVAVPLSDYIQAAERSAAQMNSESRLIPNQSRLISKQGRVIPNQGRVIPNQGEVDWLEGDFCIKGLEQRSWLQQHGHARFLLLINTIHYFQRLNAQIVQKQENSTLNSQLCFCNELLLKLSLKGCSQLLWKHLALDKSAEQQSTLILHNQLLNLQFTFGLLKLRTCIRDGSFHQIVLLFNQFITQIAPSFLHIVVSLQELLKEGRGKGMGLRYLGELTQCLIVLVREKSKVVNRNRYLFKVICSQVCELLKELQGTRQEEKQLIQKHLQKVTNQIAN